MSSSPGIWRKIGLLNASVVEGENIGTTLRGIGPCYRDKVGRNFAIRLGDMYRPDFLEKIRQIAAAKQLWLGSLSPGATGRPGCRGHLRPVPGLRGAAEALRG